MNYVELSSTSKSTPGYEEAYSWEKGVLHADFFVQFFENLCWWDKTSLLQVSKTSHHYFLKCSNLHLTRLQVSVKALLSFCVDCRFEDLSTSLQEVQSGLLVPTNSLPVLAEKLFLAKKKMLSCLSASKAAVRKPLKDIISNRPHLADLKIFSKILCWPKEEIFKMFKEIIDQNSDYEHIGKIRAFEVMLKQKVDVVDAEDLIWYEAFDYLLSLKASNVNSASLNMISQFLSDPIGNSRTDLIRWGFIELATRRYVSPQKLRDICANKDVEEMGRQFYANYVKDDVLWPGFKERMPLEMQFGMQCAVYIQSCLPVIGAIAKRDGFHRAMHIAKCMFNHMLEMQLIKPSLSEDVEEWAHYAIAGSSSFEDEIKLVEALKNPHLKKMGIGRMLYRAARPGYSIEAGQFLLQMETKEYFFPFIQAMYENQMSNEFYVFELNGQERQVHYPFQALMLKACDEGSPEVVFNVLERFGNDDVYSSIVEDLAIALARKGDCEKALHICQKAWHGRRAILTAKIESMQPKPS